MRAAVVYDGLRGLFQTCFSIVGSFGLSDFLHAFTAQRFRQVAAHCRQILEDVAFWCEIDESVDVRARIVAVACTCFIVDEADCRYIFVYAWFGVSWYTVDKREEVPEALLAATARVGRHLS